MTASIRVPEPLRGALAVAALALAGALPARAELVELVDGAVLKVERFEAVGEQATLRLPGGGLLSLALERVERVVDDEIDPAAAAATASLGGDVFPLHFDPAQAVPPATPWSDAILAAARRHGINPALVAAVVQAESAFDPRARSHKGARGLMQIMPATGRRFGLRPGELCDPEKNLDAGVRYLAWLADRFEDDLPRVLAGYNAGEGAVARYGGVPPYRETIGYLKRIYGRLGLDAVVAAGSR
jgi:soluble lytic murein transglycosylase-like protein